MKYDQALFQVDIDNDCCQSHVFFLLILLCYYRILLHFILFISWEFRYYMLDLFDLIYIITCRYKIKTFISRCIWKLTGYYWYYVIQFTTSQACLKYNNYVEHCRWRQHLSVVPVLAVPTQRLVESHLFNLLWPSHRSQSQIITDNHVFCKRLMWQR